MPVYLTLVGTIADVDETTPENPCHPSPVVILEIEEWMERGVLAAWAGRRELLQVGRRLRVSGECEFAAKPVTLPVALHVGFIDVH